MKTKEKLSFFDNYRHYHSVIHSMFRTKKKEKKKKNISEILFSFGFLIILLVCQGRILLVTDFVIYVNFHRRAKGFEGENEGGGG